MSYREYKGNLFRSNAQTLVNTVNCVGVMGKGVALEFRRRFPAMFEEYKRVCSQGCLRPGEILPYPERQPRVLNLAVKDDWRHPSKLAWVESCLRNFVRDYEAMGITSVAFPWIGAMNGKLPWNRVHELMYRYLRGLPRVDVEVVEFDPSVGDPLFDKLEQAVAAMNVRALSAEASLSIKLAESIWRTIRDREARSLAELTVRVPMGTTSTDNLYRFLVRDGVGADVRPARQLSLF